MFKTKKYFVILITLIIMIFLMTACDMLKDKFANYSSGEKIVLSLENYDDFVELKFKKLEALRMDDNLFYGIVFQYVCKGYEVFSYYNVELTITVKAKALNDSGVYEDLEFTEIVFLNETGNAKQFDIYEFENRFRNLKDISWDVTYVKGFVVKK